MKREGRDRGKCRRDAMSRRSIAASAAVVVVVLALSDSSEHHAVLFTQPCTNKNNQRRLDVT